MTDMKPVRDLDLKPGDLVKVGVLLPLATVEGVVDGGVNLSCGLIVMFVPDCIKVSVFRRVDPPPPRKGWAAFIYDTEAECLEDNSDYRNWSPIRVIEVREGDQ
jgi:hypothetical protein